MLRVQEKTKMLKPLPANTATFRKIIEGNFLYIDKTQYLYELVQEGTGAFFLSRPRRFGKSLLLSMLEELFLGNRELFQGLWIAESDYDWPTHPVIRLDFSRHDIRTVDDLEMSIQTQLQRVGQQYGVEIPVKPPSFMFEELIFQLSTQKQVVILVDEYDKPLISHLTNLPVAREIQRTLKGFYGVVKSMERHVRLVFITGVSKFSRVSLFSELNNLTDLTMRPAFATALGLTEPEIRENLAEHIADFAPQEGLTADELLAKMRHWYNGFCFASNLQNVYNPYSIMLLFDAQKFANYWFESATPTFLIDILHQQNYDIQQLENLRVDELASVTAKGTYKKKGGWGRIAG